MHPNSDNTISFSIFTRFPELFCTMSTRSTGNLMIKDKITTKVRQFIKIQGIRHGQFIAMEQCHGNKVEIVTSQSSGMVIKGVDGLVTTTQELYIGVNTADCVPLFFYDPEKKLIAVIHAGWKGTLGNIAGNTVKLLQELGSDPKDIVVVIGPHIGGCCYDVSSVRARLFLKTFNNQNISFKVNGKWFLDIGQANNLQMQKYGILQEHIDAPIHCTSCQNDRFFSFRKDSKDCFGEMLGVIGMRN